MRAPLNTLKVTCPFGWRKHPVSGVRQFHNGVDLRAAEGTPVVAPFSGKVAITSSKSGGLQLILTHESGIRAGFAHLSSIEKGLSAGSQVNEGDIVAYTGHSGVGTGPHLHFTLSLVGKGGSKTFFNPVAVFPMA